MLKEAEGYISGQEICEKFNVSRTAVWKVIKQLETEGYLIEAVRNKGYRLKMAGDILSRAEIESSMNTKWAGKKVLYFDETGSTNTEAKQAAEAGAPHGTLAVADYQNMGKGRRGRMWTSPRGVGVWMSLMIRPEIHPSAAGFPNSFRYGQGCHQSQHGSGGRKENLRHSHRDEHRAGMHQLRGYRHGN